MLKAETDVYTCHRHPGGVRVLWGGTGGQGIRLARLAICRGWGKIVSY